MSAAEQKSKDQILYFLKTRGPLTSAQIAERLEITPMGVRLHMAALEESGLVESEEIREGVGRPAKVWRLTDSATKRFPETHAELAVGMIDAIRKVLGEEGLAKVLGERTARQKSAYSSALAACATLGDRVRMLAKIRADEGYMAAWVADGDGFMLIENNCPICAAAKACTGICDGELELFGAVLGHGVSIRRTEHIVEGARRCVYEITAK